MQWLQYLLISLLYQCTRSPSRHDTPDLGVQNQNGEMMYCLLIHSWLGSGLGLSLGVDLGSALSVVSPRPGAWP